MKIAAALSTLLCAATIAVLIADMPISIIAILFMLALVAIGVVLSRGLMLLRKIRDDDVGSIRLFGPAHIITHIIPITYLVSLYFWPGNTWLNLIFLFPFAAFFYTGKRTWKALYERVNNRVYMLYSFGNSGMLSGIFVATVLNLVLLDRIRFSFFDRLLLFYLSIHFLLVGISVYQLTTDIERVHA